jgi:hypothetical protein
MKSSSYLCKIKLENMVLLGLLAIGLVAEIIWSPRLDFIKEENMLLLHYNKKQSRDYLVIVKF